MSRLSATVVVTAVGMTAGLSWWFARPDFKGVGAAPAVKETGVFGLTRVHTFHLEVSAAEWERMQPDLGPAKPADTPRGKPADSHRNLTGLDFPWVHADLSEDGVTYRQVGLRYKGNGSYMNSLAVLKRSLKVEFDHYDGGLRYHGLKTLHLNAGDMDPTKAREVLAYAVYHAAGVPAPRTAFAEVTLTVPGKYDHERLGLFTVVEQVDKTFLREHFKDGKGLLMKPLAVRDLEYLGDDWAAYKDLYQPKHDPSAREARRFIELARLVNQADDAHFQKEIGTYLDVEEFLRFAAASALIVNFDNFFALGHNYYIYQDPETGKFVFIPWDLDLAFGGYILFGPPGRQADLSLTHPYPGQCKLMDRLMAVPEARERYRQVLKELSATCFAEGRLVEDLDAVENATGAVLDREKKAAKKRGEGELAAFDLRTFIGRRTDSAAAQLAGERQGWIPVISFGAPAGREVDRGP